jgi:hypothetical protein
MRALLFALLLHACDAPSDHPRLIDASATCDEADGAWRLAAVVEHDGGPDRVVSVYFDLAILLGGGVDTQYIGSHLLLDEGGGAWGLDLPIGTTQLECGGELDYLLTITAEDDDGDQAAAQIGIDSLGVRLD